MCLVKEGWWKVYTVAIEEPTRDKQKLFTRYLLLILLCFFYKLNQPVLGAYQII